MTWGAKTLLHDLKTILHSWLNNKSFNLLTDYIYKYEEQIFNNYPGTSSIFLSLRAPAIIMRSRHELFYTERKKKKQFHFDMNSF